MLSRAYCEQADQLRQILRDGGIAAPASHVVANETDLGALLRVNAGIAIAPLSTPLSLGTKRVHVEGIELKRTVQIYGVAGRQRSPAAGTLVKLLRAADWSTVGV